MARSAHQLSSIYRDIANATCGVYFLLMGAEIVYVGSSLNIQRRVTEHIERGREFDRVMWLTVNDDFSRHLMERQFIRKMRPAQNIHGVGDDIEGDGAPGYSWGAL